MWLSRVINKTRHPLTKVVLLSFINHLAFNGGRFTLLLSALTLTNGSSVISGMLLAVLSLFPMLTALSLGRFIDHHDKRIPMILGSLLLILANLLAALFQNIPVLFLSVILLGNANNMHQLSVQQMISESAHSAIERVRIFALSSLVISTSLMLMPMVSGFMIKWYSHQLVFYILSVLPFFTLFFIWLWRKQLLQLHGLLPTHKTKKVEEIKDSVWVLMKQRSIFNVLMTSLAISTAWELHSFVIPIMGKQMSMDEARIGLLITSFSAGTFAIRVLMRWIVNRFHSWQIIHGAIVIAGIIYLIYPWSEFYWLMVILSFVLGMALGSCQPNILAMLHEVSPIGRGGELAGLRTMFAYASGVAIPLISGVLTEKIGIGTPFIMISCLLIWARWIGRDQSNATNFNKTQVNK